MATTMAKATKNPAVIVRTYSAGVHYGHLAEQSADGKRVVLAGARRIWSWKGANTLHEISLRGVGSGSRVSERVERITLTEAIEVIECAAAGESAMESAPWAA
jgi:hypothetical protein